MAEGAGHDKSPTRACRARPARAADSPRFAPTRPCLAGMGRPGRPAPRPVPIRSAYQTPLPPAVYASSAQAALIRSAVPPLPTKPEGRLCGGPIRAKSARLRFLASPLPTKVKGAFAEPHWLERNRFRQYTTPRGKSTAFFVERQPNSAGRIGGAFGQIILPVSKNVKCA